MKKVITGLLLILIFNPANPAQNNSSEAILTDLLHKFMEGATVNDADVHNRFWADDLIYTSSSGERFGKANIMDGLPSEPTEPTADDPVYSAEDIEIQVYGDTAIVAFRLVANIQSQANEQMNFYNTGTFLKRDGKWQAVAWQATRIPD